MSDVNIWMDKTYEKLTHLKAKYEQDLKAASTKQERLIIKLELDLIVEAWHAKRPMGSS